MFALRTGVGSCGGRLVTTCLARLDRRLDGLGRLDCYDCPSRAHRPTAAAS